MQEPLRWEDIYSAKYPLEAARSGQEVWGTVRQLCWEKSGAN